MSNEYVEDERLYSDKVLEDEFTTWTALYVYDAGIGSNLTNPYVDNEGYTLIQDNVLASDYQIDRYGAITMNPVGFFHSTYGDSILSHTNKYILEPYSNFPIDIISIYRHGIMIWNRSITLDEPLADRCRQATISPNGRFIGVVLEHAVSNIDRYYVLYEGS